MKIISLVDAALESFSIESFCDTITLYNNFDNGVEAKPFSLSLKSNFQKETVEHLVVYFGGKKDLISSKSIWKFHSCPAPVINLEIESMDYFEEILISISSFETILIEHQPNWVVINGNTSLSVAFVVAAKKKNIKICFIETGLNDDEKSINEKVNYLMTMHLSDLILSTDKLSISKLLNYGIEKSKIYNVGNFRLDKIVSNLNNASNMRLGSIIKENIEPDCFSKNVNITDNSFDIIHLQLPMNIHFRESFDPLVTYIKNQFKSEHPLVWILYPTVKKQLIDNGLWTDLVNKDGVILVRPINDLEMMRLIRGAQVTITDSIDIQEACYVSDTPCIAMRWKTDSPVTLIENGGTSILVGNDIERLKSVYFNTNSKTKNTSKSKLWDGHTAERCLEAILSA